MAVISAKPWIPLVTSNEPAKEEEPVPEKVLVPEVVKAPEMEAVPPTSNIVSVLLPALIPNLEAKPPSSKDSEPEALTKEKRPVWVVVPVILVLPLTVKAVPTIAAALKPLETNNEPAKEEEPVPEKVLVPEVKKLPETEATPPNDAVPLTSMSLEMRRSLLVEI